ncbi:amino acid permease, partial [Mycobacterium tuberculosis]
MVGPRTRGYAIHKLGFCSVVMLGINSIIGAGIFLTPGEVIGLAGPFAPMAYVLAGIFAGVVAIVFATAARYVRTNGASYAYTTAAFGRRIGIYVGVTHAITASIAWGVLASF